VQRSEGVTSNLTLNVSYFVDSFISELPYTASVHWDIKRHVGEFKSNSELTRHGKELS